MVAKDRTVRMRVSNSEARRAKRKSFTCAGTLDIGGGALLPCEVADISDAGARVSIFSDPYGLPDLLALVLSPNGKVRRNCRVVWRSETQIGLQFLKINRTIA
jgi:hypothetical protein